MLSGAKHLWAIAVSRIRQRQSEIELVRLPTHSPLPVRGFTVHVTRPTRSILRFAQNDITGLSRRFRRGGAADHSGSLALRFG